MKKLFFAALLAAVAVSGSFAQYQAQPESSNPNAAIFDCEGSGPTCRAQSSTLYPANSSTLITDNPGVPGNPYDLAFNP